MSQLMACGRAHIYLFRVINIEGQIKEGYAHRTGQQLQRRAKAKALLIVSVAAITPTTVAAHDLCLIASAY